MQIIARPQRGQRCWAIIQKLGQYASDAAPVEVVDVKADRSGRKAETVRLKFNELTDITVSNRGNGMPHFISGDREFIFVDAPPDLRYLRATVRCAALCHASYIFAQASALGGGEAPGKLLANLVQVHPSRWEDIVDSVARANRSAMRVDGGSKAFEVSRDVIRWRCAQPQCGYNAPPTLVVLHNEVVEFAISVKGRPDGVAKRLSAYQGAGIAFEQVLEMPDPETIAA